MSKIHSNGKITVKMTLNEEIEVKLSSYPLAECDACSVVTLISPTVVCLNSSRLCCWFSSSMEKTWDPRSSALKGSGGCTSFRHNSFNEPSLEKCFSIWFSSVHINVRSELHSPFKVLYSSAYSLSYVFIFLVQ